VPDPLSENYENTLLMVLTQNRFHEFDREEISQMTIKLYKDLYDIDEEAFVLKGILENIPEKIELTGKYFG
jgi:hypothetical protein